MRWPSRRFVSGRHHPSRVELGPMPTWVVRMVNGVSIRVVLGSDRVPGEGWPLFSVLADVESGAWVGVGPIIIQRHYEVLAIWLRTRLS